jgi:hypothetical protein
MKKESQLWKVLPLIVALITCAVPAYVSYDLYFRGTVPERQLELDKRTAINPLADLNLKGDRVALKLTVGDRTFDNVVIKSFTLKNSGKTPVVPSDYQEPLSVKVESPWQIIAIETDPLFEEVALKWHRVTDQCFEARPALINPGDYISQKVYLTNTKYSTAQKLGTDVDIAIHVRITNMRRFATAPSILDQFKAPIWLAVYLDGPATLFTVVVASVFLLWYLILLQKSGLLARFRFRTYMTIVGLAVLSISVAEVIAYYIFGGYPSLFKRSALDWRGEWHNWFALLLHIGVSVYLYRRSVNVGSDLGAAEVSPEER